MEIFKVTLVTSSNINQSFDNNNNHNNKNSFLTLKLPIESFSADNGYLLIRWRGTTCRFRSTQSQTKMLIDSFHDALSPTVALQARAADSSHLRSVQTENGVHLAYSVGTQNSSPRGRAVGM